MSVLGRLPDSTCNAMTIRDFDELRTETPLPHLIQPDVTQDREKPSFQVATRSQRTQCPNGTNICLLYKILCLRTIASQNHRIAIESIDIDEAICIGVTWHLK